MTSAPGPSRPWLILALLVLASLGLRAAYLLEQREAPDFAAPLADAAFHDYWARAIVSGNWNLPAGFDDPRLGEVPYTRPPGYSWLLAAVYWTFGDSHIWPRVVQVALGLLTMVMGFLLGRTVFNDRAGLLLAAMIGGYWVFIHYEGELQEPALLGALAMGLTLALCQWCRRPGTLLAILAGLIIGAFAITRPNILLFAPAAVLWMLWCGRRRGFLAVSLRHAALTAVAAGLVIAPVTLRNYRVSDDFVLVSCNGPINFYIGNNPDSDGHSFVLPELRELTGLTAWGWFSYDRVVRGLERHTGRPMSYTDASRYFNARAWAFIRENPGRFLELCAKRALLFWSPGEVANNKVEQYERQHSRVLRWLPNTSLMLALSLAGLGWLLIGRIMGRGDVVGATAAGPERRREMLALIGLFIAIYFLSFVPFLVATRFRAPLLPIVFLFAAFGVDRLVALARQRQWRPVAASAAGVAAVFALFMLIASASAEERRDLPRWHTDRGAAFAATGRHDRAIAEFRAAVAVNPQFVASYATWFESALALDDLPQAMEIHRRLIAHRPDRLDVQRQMAAQLANLGEERLRRAEAAGAVEALTFSLRINPQQPETHVNLGVAKVRLGDRPAALRHFRESVALNPNLALGWFNLGLSLHHEGDLAAAAEAYRRAIDINPRSDDAIANLASIHATQGRWEEARRGYELALEINPAHEGARALLQRLNEMHPPR